MSYSKALHFKNSAYQAHFAQGITININVLGSEIYSESRFFIIGHDDWDKLEYFINSSVKPMDYDSLYKFSPDKMMSTIVYDFIEK